MPLHCLTGKTSGLFRLAMLSMQMVNPMIGQLYDLLHLFWKTYHFSPKSLRKLTANAADLGVNVLMSCGVKGTRWLPHILRALGTFIKPGQLLPHGPFGILFYQCCSSRKRQKSLSTYSKYMALSIS